MTVFDELSERYDRWYEEEGKDLFKKELSLLKRAVGSFGKGVEIGVGSGRFAEALGIEYGIDPSLNMLKIAKRRKIKAILGTGEELPLKSYAFDLVLIAFTLCFVKDPGKVIGESRRVMKDTGKLVIAFIPSEGKLGKSYRKMGEEGHPIYKEAKFISEEELREILHASGFNSIERLAVSLTEDARSEDFVVYTCTKL